MIAMPNCCSRRRQRQRPSEKKMLAAFVRPTMLRYHSFYSFGVVKIIKCNNTLILYYFRIFIFNAS